MENKLEWLENRRKGVGGSDVAIIMQESNYCTRYNLFLDKTGQIPVEVTDSERAYWGTKLENVVIDEFFKRNPQYDLVELQSKHKREMLVGNIDALIVNKVTGEEVILEIKTSDKYMAKKWGIVKDTEEEAIHNDLVPRGYLYQVHHYMYTAGLSNAIIAVLIGGNEYREYKISFDANLWNKIFKEIKEFWSCVEKKEYDNKDITPTEDVKTGKEKLAVDALLIELSELKDVKAQIKELEAVKKELENSIKTYLDDSDTLITEEGSVVATYKTTRSFRFDTKRFKQEQKDLYNKYVSEQETRRFLVK